MIYVSTAEFSLYTKKRYSTRSTTYLFFAKKNSHAYAHGRFFLSGDITALCEASHKNELFQLPHCGDIKLSQVKSKVMLLQNRKLEIYVDIFEFYWSFS